MTLPTLNASDGECWIDCGEGSVVLLVHGIGGTTASWAPVLAPLGATHRVIAWAFPGYESASPIASAVPTAAAYAARALGLLERLSVPSVWIVGHSHGAVVAAEIMRLAPKRVDGITLICPVSGFGSMSAELREAIHEGGAKEIAEGGMGTFAAARTGSIVGPKIDPCALEEIIATMASIPTPAYLAAWRMLCDADVIARLEGYDGPAIVIGGDHDPVAPVESVTAVAGALGVEPYILEDIGHFPMHEATEMLLALMRPAASPA